MGLRIGVVCEGSHDFNVLKEFASAIVRHHGETIDLIDCIQPEVSATFQVTSGGWTQVKAWCERQGGEWYRKFLDKPLFSSSKAFDILIISLDGDVVEHCEHPPLTGLRLEAQSVERIIAALEDAVTNYWLKLQHNHRSRIVVCVPVRHLEAWLTAGLGPELKDPEAIDTKDLFRSGPGRNYRGDWRLRYIAAARQATDKLVAIRSVCTSFVKFETDLRTAADQV